jgi:hypothetical protein
MAARNRTTIQTGRAQIFLGPSAVGTGGTALGYTEDGITIEWGDEYIEEPTEETGAGVGAIFFAGGDPIVSFTLKQWDDDTLALRFPNRYAAASDRIELPGTLNPGDSMLSHAKVLEIRPDVSTYPTVLLRQAILIGAPAREPTRFRTSETKKLAMAFRCLPDDTIGSGDAKYPYRVLGVAPAANLTL